MNLAKTLKINGVKYEDVSSLKIPLYSNPDSYAYFYDTEISSGEGASSSDIREGRRAYINGVEVSGSLVTRTEVDLITAGAKVTIPAGIYDTSISKTIPNGSAVPNFSYSVSGITVGTSEADFDQDYFISITPQTSVDVPGYITSISDGNASKLYLATESKTVDPALSTFVVTPSTGKLLKSVTVNAVRLSGTATAGDVLAGKTFYKDSLTPISGTLTVPQFSLSSNILTIS